MGDSKTHIEIKSLEGPVPSEEPMRKRAAKLIYAQRAQIYRRISTLLVPEARQVTDTEEVLSTALRRVDRLIARGLFRGEEDEQLYALVHRVLERTIREKARNARRQRAREQIVARLNQDRANAPPLVISSELCERVGQLTRDPIDREIALLRGRGMKFHEIAESMEMSPAGVRKRWSRIRRRAEELAAQEPHHDDH